MKIGGSQKANIVKAPMPGMVLNILVEPGQQVTKGDSLLILEAMKMENMIKAAGDGVIKAVHVQTGAAVDKGQLLLKWNRIFYRPSSFIASQLISPTPVSSAASSISNVSV
ncbi:MAG: acetyl-CoA carboxylase biotin carboxyl carrier protein subunit [Saprospiraceae bacterium]